MMKNEIHDLEKVEDLETMLKEWKKLKNLREEKEKVMMKMKVWIEIQVTMRKVLMALRRKLKFLRKRF